MQLSILLSLSYLATLVAGQLEPPVARILIYSATARFRHDSIPVAIEALQAAGPSINVHFENTEAEARFTVESLAEYDALVFLSNTGEVLDSSGKAALQTYLNSGGNFVAIHSASDCLRNATFFVRELGARFDYHADLQEAALEVIGPAHPSTENLSSPWRIRDEMYNFESDPRSLGAIVALAADESSYIDNGPRRFDHGSPHPIAWYQERGAGVEEGGVAGRSFHTSLGHLNETWQDPIFVGHVLGGIRWVLQSNTTRVFNPGALVGNPDAASTTPGPTSTQLGVLGATEVTTSSPPPASESRTDSSALRERVPLVLVIVSVPALTIAFF